jgi:hypothetical protein
MYIYFGRKRNSYWQDFALYTLPLSATEPPASLLALVRTLEAGDPSLNRSNKNNKSLERVSLGPHIHYAALQVRRADSNFSRQCVFRVSRSLLRILSQIQGQKESGSASASKNLSLLTQKLFLSSRRIRSGMFISDPDPGS